MVEIADAKHWVKLQNWSEMIAARMASGQTVKTWCKENDLSIKTYYYRLRRIRIAALQEPEKASMFLPVPKAPSPAFARLDFSTGKEAGDMIIASKNTICAATVRIGDIAVDINNGAEPGLIASTLRSIREIC